MGLTATLSPDEVRYHRLLKQNALLRDRVILGTVLEIKKAIALEDPAYAIQLWNEFSHDEQRALWVAPSYGGILDTAERDRLKGL